MSENAGPEHHDGVVRRTIERLEEHHREHRHEAQERRRRDDLAAAGYDVETDTGVEVDRPHEAGAAYDVAADTAEQVRPDPAVPTLDDSVGGPD